MVHKECLNLDQFSNCESEVILAQNIFRTESWDTLHGRIERDMAVTGILIKYIIATVHLIDHL